MYAKQLPRPIELEWLSKLAGPYPNTRDDMVNTSRDYGFRVIVTKFLKLFPSNTQFENKDDFVTRSEELEHLIREERAGPEEPYIHDED